MVSEVIISCSLYDTFCCLHCSVAHHYKATEEDGDQVLPGKEIWRKCGQRALGSVGGRVGGARQSWMETSGL